MGEWAEGRGSVSKKPPENAMELREFRLLHHLKPTQTMLKKRGFLGVLTPNTGGTFARIKFYLQICTSTVKTVPSCFLLNL